MREPDWLCSSGACISHATAIKVRESPQLTLLRPAGSIEANSLFKLNNFGFLLDLFCWQNIQQDSSAGAISE